LPLQREALLTAYQRSVEVTRDSVVNFGLEIWGELGSYRDGDIDRFITRMVPRLRSGQYRIASLTAAYVWRSARADGIGVPLVPVNRELIAGARNVEPTVEYRRPAITTYTALSKKQPLAQAIAAGAIRLNDLLTTDMQLAKTAQARASLQRSGYTYYRRVLTGAENCALCSIASTQRYHVRDLMPIHPGCDCGVEAVGADYDPGQVLDPDLLDQVHGDVSAFAGGADRGGRDPDYRKLLVTRQNGEYGPTLAWRSDAFTALPA